MNLCKHLCFSFDRRNSWMQVSNLTQDHRGVMSAEYRVHSCVRRLHSAADCHVGCSYCTMSTLLPYAQNSTVIPDLRNPRSLHIFDNNSKLSESVQIGNTSRKKFLFLSSKVKENERRRQTYLLI